MADGTPYISTITAGGARIAGHDENEEVKSRRIRAIADLSAVAPGLRLKVHGRR